MQRVFVSTRPSQRVRSLDNLYCTVPRLTNHHQVSHSKRGTPIDPSGTMQVNPPTGNPLRVNPPANARESSQELLYSRRIRNLQTPITQPKTYRHSPLIHIIIKIDDQADLLPDKQVPNSIVRPRAYRQVWPNPAQPSQEYFFPDCRGTPRITHAPPIRVSIERSVFTLSQLSSLNKILPDISWPGQIWDC